MKRILIAGLLLGGCSSVPDRMDTDNYEPVYENYQAPQKQNGSIFTAGKMLNPYGADVAVGVGDIITVVLVESMSASKRSASDSSKSTDVKSSPLALAGNVVTTGGLGGTDMSVDLSSSNGFKGKGSTSQSNEIDGRVSVTVQKVLPNGNLFIKGEKWIRINTGEELVKISGVVRPTDVQSGNLIESTKIADARIIYSGEGHLKDATEPGFLFKFFNSSWWPL